MSIGSITFMGRRPALALEPERIICPSCDGRGWKSYPFTEADGETWYRSYDCPECNGNGWTWRDGTAAPHGTKRPPNS